MLRFVGHGTPDHCGGTPGGIALRARPQSSPAWRPRACDGWGRAGCEAGKKSIQNRKFKIQNGCKPFLSKVCLLNIRLWNVLSDFSPKLCAGAAPGSAMTTSMFSVVVTWLLPPNATHEPDYFGEGAIAANVASSKSHISRRWRRRPRASRGVPGLASVHSSVMADAFQAPPEINRELSAASPCWSSKGRAALASGTKSGCRPTRRNQ